MEQEYGSLEKLKKAYETTKNMKFMVEIENWEYYKEHPDEPIETSETLITHELSLSNLDFELLDIIKHKNPKSIREVADIVNKSVSNVQPRLKKLESEGLVSFVEGNRNSLIPTLPYDDIRISI